MSSGSERRVFRLGFVEFGFFPPRAKDKRSHPVRMRGNNASLSARKARGVNLASLSC